MDSTQEEHSIKELTLDEAMGFAVAMLRDGNVEAGVEICRRILAVMPEHVDALHFLGLGLYQKGQQDEGIASIRRALELAPGYADAWNNLGNIFNQRDRPQEAEAAYRRVLEVDEQHADAWNNLATALKEQDRLEEAEFAVRHALEVAPQHADAHHTLGNVLRELKRPQEALESFKRAMSLRPRDADSFRSLGAALYAVGQIDEAAEVYKQWLEMDAQDPYAKHMLAACTRNAIPDRASDAFVAGVFDRFASSFDRVLDRLHYRAPDLVVEALEEYLGPGPHQLLVADAGCGTGLCGPLLRPLASHLVGVDISSAMIDRARERRWEGQPPYDELEVAELTAYFSARAQAFDIVASADTLCYFGKLEPPLQALATALRPRGLLSFTVEQAQEEQAPAGFLIHPHGRYSHTELYVRRVLKAAGLSAKLVNPVQLRMEKGEPVQGLLVLAKRLRQRGERHIRGEEDLG